MQISPLFSPVPFGDFLFSGAYSFALPSTSADIFGTTNLIPVISIVDEAVELHTERVGAPQLACDQYLDGVGLIRGAVAIKDQRRGGGTLTHLRFLRDRVVVVQRAHVAIQSAGPQSLQQHDAAVARLMESALARPANQNVLFQNALDEKWMHLTPSLVARLSIAGKIMEVELRGTLLTLERVTQDLLRKKGIPIESEEIAKLFNAALQGKLDVILDVLNDVVDRNGGISSYRRMLEVKRVFDFSDFAFASLIRPLPDKRDCIVLPNATAQLWGRNPADPESSVSIKLHLPLEKGGTLLSLFKGA